MLQSMSAKIDRLLRNLPSTALYAEQHRALIAWAGVEDGTAAEQREARAVGGAFGEQLLATLILRGLVKPGEDPRAALEALLSK